MGNRPKTLIGSAKPRQRGLTLVELLVAISVLGFVAVLGWRGLDSIARARVALNSDLEQTRGMQLAFAQLQSDCEHLASPYVLPNRTPLLAGHGRLTLVRTVYADNRPSQLQVISYRVDSGVLTRRESATTRDLRVLDKLMQGAAGDADTDPGVTLQSEVSDMEMRLWINGAWHTEADLLAAAAASPLIPTGMEVTLQLGGHEHAMVKIFLLGAV